MKLDVTLATEILPELSEGVWAEYYRQRSIGIREIHRTLFLAPINDVCIEFLGRLIDSDVNEQALDRVTGNLLSEDFSIFDEPELRLVLAHARKLLVDAVRKQLVVAG